MSAGGDKAGFAYSLSSWSEEGEPLRLIQQSVAKDDLPEPKALSCYGLYVPELDDTWLRFVDGRPVDRNTTREQQGSSTVPQVVKASGGGETSRFK